MKDTTGRKQMIEDTMACTAFAESWEPCPLDEERPAEDNKRTTPKIDSECALFHEHAQECFLSD